MTGLSLILQCMLAGVLCVIAVLSLQLVVLGYLRLFRAAPRVRTPLLPDEALPRVLVQLPVCDEGPLAVRVAAAAARMDWPLDKLEIQVLDDGRAGDPQVLVDAIMSVVPQGVNLKIMRRGERSGFKAGNLAFGLKHCDAPYVAIFDADFVPPTDFLRRMVPALVADSGLAYVQARWGHANRTRNWLTRAQGMLLDAHFAVEQEARFRAGLPMSFNGTAGVWSRGCDRPWRRLDRRHADRRSRSFHALRDEGLAHRADVRRRSARRIARNGGGVACAAGALDQGPCADRAQASARRSGQATCRCGRRRR